MVCTRVSPDGPLFNKDGKSKLSFGNKLSYLQTLKYKIACCYLLGQREKRDYFLDPCFIHESVSVLSRNGCQTN